MFAWILNTKPLTFSSSGATAPDANATFTFSQSGITSVTIVYSNGAGTIVLDDYVGQKQSYAERKLAKQDLDVVVRIQSVENESDDGIVLSQSPAGGLRVSPGSRVSLVVGEFTPPPPRVTGRGVLSR